MSKLTKKKTKPSRKELLLLLEECGDIFEGDHVDVPGMGARDQCVIDRVLAITKNPGS